LCSQSSFETLSTDSEPSEWVNVSFYSPVFLLDLFSCIACTFEGFCDLLFVPTPRNGYATD